ncbi:MAG TPA: NAD(P)H-binding protein [Pseudonocardiaceae bacterium]|jgi:hypothetical protein|nr:NAD(P)H-binding protein [Pseudonocardiaceae bacterium]
MSTTSTKGFPVKKKVVVFGAGGRFGTRVVAEAAGRGHEVVAVVRKPESGPSVPDGVRLVQGDLTSADSVRALVTGADVVVSAVGAVDGSAFEQAVDTLLTVIGALPAPAPRIIHLGGGASLTAPDGGRFLDLPSFPAQYRDNATAQTKALAAYRASSGVTWTYVSPPPVHFEPGERTGHYRTGFDEPVLGADGTARLSYEDLAVAVVDEIEEARFRNARFTAGY